MKKSIVLFQFLSFLSLPFFASAETHQRSDAAHEVPQEVVKQPSDEIEIPGPVFDLSEKDFGERLEGMNKPPRAGSEKPVRVDFNYEPTLDRDRINQDLLLQRRTYGGVH